MPGPMSKTLRASSTPNAFGVAPLTQPQPSRAVFGLLKRRERWSLSWRGRLILAWALLLVGILCIKGVYPFLAITYRVNANILVVVRCVSICQAIVLPAGTSGSRENGSAPQGARLRNENRSRRS